MTSKPYRHGRSYWARYQATDPATGRRIQRRVNLHTAIESVAHARLADLLARETRNAAPPEVVRFGAALARYLAWRAGFVRPQTHARVKQILERAQQCLGNPPVRAVARSDVETYLETRAADKTPQGRILAPATLNKERDALHAFFAWAVENDFVAENPVAKVRRRRIDRDPVRWLNDTEIERLFTLLDEHEAAHRATLAATDKPGFREQAERGVAAVIELRDIVETILLCGLRRAEVQFLRARDVDLKTHTLLVRSDPEAGHAVKTRRWRQVPLPQAAVRLFLRRKQERRTGPGDRVFRTPRDLSRSYRRLVRDDALLRDTSLNTLRHTFASRLLQQGVTMATIATLLGNSLLVCERHYAALAEANLRDAVQRLDYGRKQTSHVVRLPPPRQEQRKR